MLPFLPFLIMFTWVVVVVWVAVVWIVRDDQDELIKLRNWLTPSKRAPKKSSNPKIISSVAAREAWDCLVFDARDSDRRFIEAGIMDVYDIANCGDKDCTNCNIKINSYHNSSLGEYVDRDIWAYDKRQEMLAQDKERLLQAEDRSCTCDYSEVYIDQLLDSATIRYNICALHSGYISPNESRQLLALQDQSW